MPRSTIPLTPPPPNGHVADPAAIRAGSPDPAAARHPAAVAPLTYSRAELARALGISAPTLDRLDAAGRIGPRPVRLGGRKLWVRSEVEEWLQRRDHAGELLGRDQWEVVRRSRG